MQIYFGGIHVDLARKLHLNFGVALKFDIVIIG